MFYVYLLLSHKDNKFYIGFTENISRRVEDHNSGKVASTKHRKPFTLIYYEAYLDKRDAEGREKFLKSGLGRKFLEKQLKHFLTDRRGVEQSGSSLGSSWAVQPVTVERLLSNSVKPVAAYLEVVR